jgi:thiamine pyrophosphate-dependent acetolactate synthase large subunit-like protein
MIGRIVGMLIGRKLKEKAVDVALDKVNLPDPVENAIKIAATGNVGDLLVGMPIDVAPEEALGAITKKVPVKRPKK